MTDLPQTPQTVSQLFMIWLKVTQDTFFKVLPYTLFFLVINLLSVYLNDHVALSNSKITMVSYLVTFQVLECFAFASMFYRIISLLLEKKDFSFEVITLVGLKRILPLIGFSLTLVLLASPGLIAFMFPQIPFLRLLAAAYWFFLLIKLYFAPALICIPGKGIWEAMDESALLVKEHFWRMVVLVLMMVLIIVGLTATILLIGGILPPEKYLLFKSIAMIVLFPVFHQIIAVYTVVILNDLRQRKSKKEHYVIV